MDTDPQHCVILIFFVFNLALLVPFYQCCGSESLIMRIRIQDPKNVHMDPHPDADPDPDPGGKD